MGSDEDALADLSALRVSYGGDELSVSNLLSTPLEQFSAWFADASSNGVVEPNAMTLATADVDGQPSARTVLLKGVDAPGFSFFTNLESRKSQELANNGRASLVFPWHAIRRQVVVIGSADAKPRDEVDAYFASRPRSSQLGAWASHQSAVIPDRVALDAAMAELEGRYPDETAIPTPPFWGGWLIRPTTVEFWQGRASRLHDRLRFRAIETDPDLGRAAHWVVERLAP